MPKQLHTSAYVPDTAGLSLDLSESSQLCAQSLFVRSSPSLLRTWSLKWKRDSWTQHLFGRILKPSLGKAFETAWTSLLEATPVNPSRPQENGLEQTILATSGHSSQTAFDFSDPSSASLKTSKDISASDSEKSLENWNQWVTKCRGEYSQRLNAVRHTSGSGSLSWPTVQASEVRQGFQDRSRGMKGQQESLTTVVIKQAGHPVPANSSTDGSRLGWLTPQVQDSKHSGANPTENGDRDLLVNQVNWQTATVSTGAHRQKDGSMTDKLDQQVKTWATPRAGCPGSRAPGTGGKVLEEQVKAWATPKASDPQHSGPNMRDSAGNYALPAQAVREQWATPQSRDAKGAEGRMIREGHCSDLPSQTEVAPTGQWNRSNGKLNPRWVEILMNLPVGWTMPSCASPVTIEPTNCDSSATELCQQQQSELLEL